VIASSRILSDSMDRISMFLTAKGPYGYARGHRWLEVACIVGHAIQLGYIGWRLVVGVDTWAEIALASMCFVLGYFLADVISGIVHWTGDTIGSEQTPLLGQNFVKPFRMHHVDPKDITRHDFIETNGNNCIVSVLVIAHVVVLMPSEPGFFFYYGALMMSCALWIFGTNQFHKWAHADHVHPVVAWFQRAGLILGKEHHTIHHTVPHDTYYCITHGLMNPVLHRIRFFRALEWVVALVRPGWLYLDERERVAARRAAG
jgi:plasmanylethanolamine desaturase